MLRFVVFENGGMDSAHFPPRHAFVHGPDELPLQSQIHFENGVLRCEHSVPHSSAVSVQVELSSPRDGEARGVLALPTCLLPSRQSPYLLSIELARHRLMLFLNKLEDWGLTELTTQHWVMAQFERARQQFTGALVAQRAEHSADSGDAREGYHPRADALARETLALAVEAGEGLAMIQAQRQIRERASGKAYADACEQYTRMTHEKVAPGTGVAIPGSGSLTLPGVCQVGVSVSPGPITESLARVAQGGSDFVSMPMRWIDMEPSEGKYSFAATDRWIEWAVRTAKIPVVAGPIVDFRPQCVPDWLYIWENDYDTLRDLVIEHVQSVVTRYRRTIARWTVASGLHVNTNFKVSFDQIMDLTRVCVALVRKLHPQAKIQLEVAQPWGEYHTTNRRSLPPLLYAEAALQSGLQIDALALRLQMGHAEPGLATRDMMALSALLDRYAQFEKPIVVSSLGCPSAPIAAVAYRPRAGSTPEDPYEPGSWRRPWTEQAQADWLAHALAVCASKPFVHSVCWHELADGLTSPATGTPPEMPHGGLVAAGGSPKLAAARFIEMRKDLRDGRCPVPLE